MSDLDEVIKCYKNSSFYKKYKNTYFSDIILRDVLKSNNKLHRLKGYKKKSYEEIHKEITEVMKDLYEGFAVETNFSDKYLFWSMLYAFYIDPDSNGTREWGGVICSADGLFSIRRIYRVHGISDQTILDYQLYRKVPIFFFPREKNGINMTRASVFGDRIDYTLFDIKKYFEAKTESEREQCRLSFAYRLPKTQAWMQAVGSFENLVEWYGIKGIFVNDSYEVFEIEKGQSEVIRDYMDTYGWEWSSVYYENLKKFVDQFMNKDK